jgi:hypothetical protein
MKEQLYKEKNAIMLYVLPKVGMFNIFPFCKIYDFSNLDVYTFMEHACTHDFYM